MTRYVAIEIPYTKDDIRTFLTRPVNPLSSNDIKRMWKVIAIGDDLDREPARALRERIAKRLLNFHRNNTGKAYKSHWSRIRFMTVQEAMRRFPHLRERLKEYDMKYYLWREKVDADKRKAAANKKERITFVTHAE